MLCAVVLFFFAEGGVKDTLLLCSALKIDRPPEAESPTDKYLLVKSAEGKRKKEKERGRDTHTFRRE